MKLHEIMDPNGYDTWAEVFDPNYSAEYVFKGGIAPKPTPEDVEDVLWWEETSPEGYASTDFAAILKLKDGSYAMVEACCDTTGFDCRGNVTWKIGPDEESVRAELSEEYK